MGQRLLHRGLAVPTDAATPHVITPHSRHKADNNFSASLYNSRTRVEVIYDFQQWYKLDDGTMVDECYYSTKIVIVVN